jgi:hypothetical protein
MEGQDQLIWQQLTAEERQRVLAILVQMLLRQVESQSEEKPDESGG